MAEHLQPAGVRVRCLVTGDAEMPVRITRADETCLRRRVPDLERRRGRRRNHQHGRGEQNLQR
jgi:hypothetical protein